MANTTDKKLDISNWSYGGAAGMSYQIPTPITEKGWGPKVELKLDYAKNFSRFTMGVGLSYMMNKMKLMPTDGASTQIDINHLSLNVGFGKETLRPLFGKRGMWGILTTGTHPYLGFGYMKIPAYTRTVGGDQVGVPGMKEKQFDIGTTYRAGLDFRVGARTLLGIGPELTLGLSYGGKSSELNRLAVQAGLTAQLRLGGSAHSVHAKGAGLDLTGLSYALALRAHGLAQRHFMNRVLNDPAEAAEDSGQMGGSDKPNGFADLPTLQTLTFLMGSVGKGSQTKLFAEAGNYRWWIAAAEAIGGIGYLFDKGTAGKSGGVGDIITAAGMLAYTIFGIDTPARRSHLDKGSLVARTRNAMLVRYAMGALAGVIGGVAVMKKPDNHWGKAMVGGGATAQGGLVFSALPFSAPGIRARTTVTYVPASIYRSGKVGDRKMNGSRGGVNIRSTIDGTHFAAEIQAMSPMAGIVNTGKRADTDEPYDDTTLPSGVGVALGAHKAWRYVNLFGGVEQVNQFGGSGKYRGGFGAKGAVEVTIPIRSRAIVLGANTRLHWLFPKNEGDPDKPSQGYQYELSPYLGVRW